MASILSVIKPIYFFTALVVGLFVVYLMQPKPEVVVKFPSPYNAGKLTYRDKAGMCYVYDADKSECPRDAGLIKPQPTFEVFTNGVLKSKFLT